MKKFYEIKRTKLCQSLALGGLMICITSMAAIDSSVPKPKDSEYKAAPTQTIEAISPTDINLSAASALYVFREADSYYFWSINDTGSLLTLLDKVTLDMSQPQAITVNLPSETAGVFYADNLVQNPQTTFIFNGQLTAGKIAIPLGKDAFIPLLDAAPVVNDEVIIDGNSPALVLAVSTRDDIYQAAANSLTDAVNLSEFSTQVMAEQVLSNRETLLAESLWADQLIDGASAQHAQLAAAFAAQIQSDVNAVTQQTADLSAQVDQELNHFNKRFLPCIEQSRIKLENNINWLGQTIESSDEELEEDPKLEAEIERSVQLAEATATQMIECGSQSASLEQVDMQGIIDTMSYEQIATSATALQQQLENDTAQWEVELSSLPGFFMHNLQTDLMVSKTEAFATRFNQWISPVYLDQSGFIAAPHQTKKSWQESQQDELKWLGKMANKGQEQLCKEETFNISFNMGVVGVVIGTWWDDQIITGNEPNLILALPGNDCVESHGGIDLVMGNSGRDRIYLGDHHDIAHGGWDTDEIHGSAGRSYTFMVGNVSFEVDLGNLIMGGAGDDFLYGGESMADRGENGVVEANGFTDIVLGDTFLFSQTAGNDYIDGEMGIDFLFGQRGDDTLINLGAGVINIAGIDAEFGSYFFGNDGNDSITGSNTNLLSTLGDFIFGAAGNDSFNGNSGRDFIFAAGGNDSGTGGGGNDFIFGSRGDDVITGGDGIDLVFGGTDNDSVSGGNGFDLVFGNAGADRVMGEDGPDLAFGNDGDDTVLGGNFTDLMFGGPGQDFMLGQDGWDLIFGNADADIVSGNDGWDLIFGNRGTDNLSGNNGNDVVFGNANGGDGFEIINGGAGMDLLFGNAGNEQIFGEAGLDVIFGNDGDDQLFGGDDLDLMFGNNGDDLVNGNGGSDLLFGNAGNDVINGAGGIDLAFGNAGCDVMDGGNDSDLLFGNDNNDHLEGGAGADLLFGNQGMDEVLGQQGTDLLFGNDDRDFLDGGDQIDVMFANGGDDFMRGGTGNDVMFGASGNDYINGQGHGDLIFGGDNNDTIDGEGGNDLAFGGSHNDRINSGNDSDFTFGGSGDDRLRAVEGRNFAFGNKNEDVIDGYWASGWDARDFLFGNQHSDNITGNKNSQKDLRAGGSGSDNKAWNTTWVSATEFNASWTSPGCQ